MTVKEYLLQYRRAEQEIDRLLEEKARWETLAEKVTPTPSKAPGRPGSNDRVGMAVAKIIDLEREIDTKVDRLVDFRREIERAVSKMHGPKERRGKKLQKRWGLQSDIFIGYMKQHFFL